VDEFELMIKSPRFLGIGSDEITIWSRTNLWRSEVHARHFTCWVSAGQLERPGTRPATDVEGRRHGRW